MHQLLQARLGGNLSKHPRDFGIRLWTTRDMPQHPSLLHPHSSHKGRNHLRLANKAGTKGLHPRDPNPLKQVLYPIRTFELIDGLSLSQFRMPNNMGLLPHHNRHIRCYAQQQPVQLQLLYHLVKALEVISPAPKCQGRLAQGATTAMVMIVGSFRQRTRRL